MRRAAFGLTQTELAARMGTTASAISRIERGQRATSSQTVKKLADAFGARAVLGFEFGSVRHPERELVVLLVVALAVLFRASAAVVGLVLLLNGLNARQESP